MLYVHRSGHCFRIKRKEGQKFQGPESFCYSFFPSSFACRDMDARLLKMTTSLLKNLKIREHILMWRLISNWLIVRLLLWYNIYSQYGWLEFVFGMQTLAYMKSVSFLQVMTWHLKECAVCHSHIHTYAHMTVSTQRMQERTNEWSRNERNLGKDNAI